LDLSVVFSPFQAEVEKSAADMKIEEISQYISAIEKQMVSVTKSCETLVRRSRETSTALFDFGQSISALGVAEGNAIGTALTQVRRDVCDFYCFVLMSVLRVEN
jgi:hypothetical protein